MAFSDQKRELDENLVQEGAVSLVYRMTPNLRLFFLLRLIGHISAYLCITHSSLGNV